MGQFDKPQSTWQLELASLCRSTSELSAFALHLEERALRIQAAVQADSASTRTFKAEVAAEEFCGSAAQSLAYVDAKTTGYAHSPSEVAQMVKRRTEDPSGTWYTSFVSLEPGVYADSSECTSLTLKVVGGLNVKKENQAEALAAYHKAYYAKGVRRMAGTNTELLGHPRAQ